MPRRHPGGLRGGLAVDPQGSGCINTLCIPNFSSLVSSSDLNPSYAHTDPSYQDHSLGFVLMHLYQHRYVSLSSLCIHFRSLPPNPSPSSRLPPTPHRAVLFAFHGRAAHILSHSPFLCPTILQQRTRFKSRGEATGWIGCRVIQLGALSHSA